MPRYFFHLLDGVRENDEAGVELSSDVAAQREAAAFLGACLRDDPDLAWGGRELRVVVVADGGRPVCTVLVQASEAPPAD